MRIINKIDYLEILHYFTTFEKQSYITCFSFYLSNIFMQIKPKNPHILLKISNKCFYNKKRRLALF